jgi:hypothetical protein
MEANLLLLTWLNTNNKADEIAEGYNDEGFRAA